MLTLHELIERQVKDRPRADALVFKGEKFSYSRLQQDIERWASVLAGRGVKAGDRFGLVMRNCPEFVITFFALVRLGARAVPVNFLLKADEIAYIFGDAGVVGVITQKPFLGNVLEARKKLNQKCDVIVAGAPSPQPSPKMGEGDLPSPFSGEGGRRPDEGTAVLSFEELLRDISPLPNLPRTTDPEEVAMIIYTSGTTGKPKGAMLTHRNFISNAEQCYGMVKSLRQKDVFLCLLPMFHSFAWTVCVQLPIYLGCKVVIIESIQPFGEVIKQIFKQRVSIFVAVPPVYAALLRVPFWWPMRWINPLRLCISGAAALPTAIHDKFEKKFGLPLMEGYGLTEASPVVTLNPENKRVPGSIGKALPGIELRIVGDAGQQLSVGEVGEICIHGANVMKGYYHEDEATREAFLDNERQWLRTGDVGSVSADGFVRISDRKKDLIIVKGLNVYPKEVEDVLLAHPAVQEAAVVGIMDDTGDEIVRAFVTLKEGADVEKLELQKLCRGKLAPYKCPKDIEIRKELPKSTLGKILKRSLRNESPKK
jgi:long-chain acyl-CoA synthetase